MARPLRTYRAAQRARVTFLAALARGISVTGAAAEASVPRRTVYEWRHSDEAFSADWDDAVDAGTDVLEDEARRRAHDGVEEPIVAMGKVARNDDGTILTVRKYSDNLMSLLLKARRPDKFRERITQDVSSTGAFKVSVAADAPVLAPDEPIPSKPVL